MEILCLISGGKDSTTALLKSMRYGHKPVALGNLYTAQGNELDSWMYQTVTTNAVEVYAQCMDLPLYRVCLSGALPSDDKVGLVEGQQDDEVSLLYKLVKRVMMDFPNLGGICTGAILSTYQRERVEYMYLMWFCLILDVICLGLFLMGICGSVLKVLWVLWLIVAPLLKEMIEYPIDAIIVKVAGIGLQARHLGRSIGEMYDYLVSLEEKYEANVCGEGGEYESFTLDCPVFKYRIVIDESHVVNHDEMEIAGVSYLVIDKLHIEKKDDANILGLNKVIEVDVDAISIDLPRVEKHPLSVELPYQFKRCNSLFSIHATSEDIQDKCIEVQTEIVLSTVEEALKSEGLSLLNVLYVEIYLKDMNNFKAMNGVYKQYFLEAKSSRACVEMSNQANDITIRCIGFNDGYKSHLHVRSVSEWAPACIGPYAQGNKVSLIYNDMLIIAGQIALDPPTMKLIDRSDESQLALALMHEKAVVASMRYMHGVPLYTNLFYVDKPLEHRDYTCIKASTLPRNAAIEIQSMYITGSKSKSAKHFSYKYNNDVGFISQPFQTEEEVQAIITEAECIANDLEMEICSTILYTTLPIQIESALTINSESNTIQILLN